MVFMIDLDIIKKEVLDIYDALAHIDPDSLLEGRHEEAYPFFGRLDRLAAMDMDDCRAQILRADPLIQPALAHISLLKNINGLRLEICHARDLIDSAAPWEALKQFVYYPNYLELARMEYTGANLSSGDRVVFLGSGPLPLTLISLWARYRILGTGIEQCREYANLSRQLIHALDLDRQIRILDGNHFSLPLPEPCQLIMIGADARPKEEIFGHLSNVLEKGATLSYRVYEKGLRRFLDAGADFKLPAGFEEITRVRPNPPVNNTSIFVVKTEPKVKDAYGDD